MEINECKVGIKVKIAANRGGGGAKHHFAIIDSITHDMFNGAPMVIVSVLGEDKVVPPDALIKIKRPKKK